MSENYKPFKNFKQMINQPTSKHWFARNELTKKEGFNGLKAKQEALKKTKKK